MTERRRERERGRKREGERKWKNQLDQRQANFLITDLNLVFLSPPSKANEPILIFIIPPEKT